MAEDRLREPALTWATRLSTFPRPSRARHITAYDYAGDELQSIKVTQSGVSATAQVQTDVFGNVTPINSPNGGADNVTYDYDPFGRVTTATGGQTGAQLGKRGRGEGRLRTALREGCQRRPTCVRRRRGRCWTRGSGAAPRHFDSQAKHFRGHDAYINGRSQLTADPRKLVERAGSGQPVGSVPRGKPGFRERIDFNETIGTYIDATTGVELATTRGILHYGNKGVHIVPARPG